MPSLEERARQIAEAAERGDDVKSVALQHLVAAVAQVLRVAMTSERPAARAN